MQYRKPLTFIGVGAAVAAALIFIVLGAYYSTITSWWANATSSTPRTVAIMPVEKEVKGSLPKQFEEPTEMSTPREEILPSQTPTITIPVPTDTSTPTATAQPSPSPLPTSTLTSTTRPTLTAVPTCTSTPVSTPIDSDMPAGTGMSFLQEKVIDSWITPRQFISLTGFVYSPAGVFQSLAAVSLGASDRSREQIGDFLDIDLQRQCRIMSALSTGSANTGGLDLSVWGDSKAVYEPGYLDLLSKCAQIAPQPVSQSGVLSWITDRIPGFNSASPTSIVPKGVGPGDGLLVVSASRFLFDWAEYPSVVEEGRGAFLLPSGESHNAPYRRVVGDFLYYQNDKVIALTITALDEHHSLVFVAPRMGGGFSYDFFKMLTAQEIEKLTNDSSLKQVDARLPNFDVASSWDMTDALVTNGVSDVFFPGIASLGFSLPGGEPYVSKVLHVSEVKLGSTERDPGTANSVIITRDQPSPSTQVVFLDRPFVVLVVDRDTNRLSAKGYVLDAK